MRSILAGYTTHVWKYIELRVYSDPFCTSYHISKMNKNPISNTPLNPNITFKWVFMDIIPAISSKNLTKDTTFSNYLLIVDYHSKLTKIYGMENITAEEVINKLDMFQSRFRKVDKFGWWDMEIIQTDAGTQFTSREF